MKRELGHFSIGTSYGGNQDWFRTFMMRIGGCGTEAASSFTRIPPKAVLTEAGCLPSLVDCVIRPGYSIQEEIDGIQETRQYRA